MATATGANTFTITVAHTCGGDSNCGMTACTKPADAERFDYDEPDECRPLRRGGGFAGIDFLSQIGERQRSRFARRSGRA